MTKEQKLELDKEQIIKCIDQYHQLLEEIKRTRRSVIEKLQIKKDELDEIYQQELAYKRIQAEQEINLSNRYRSEKQLLISKVYKCNTIEQIKEVIND